MRREFFNNFLDYDYEAIDWNVGGEAEEAENAPLTIVPLNKYVDVTFTYNGTGNLRYKISNKLSNGTNNTFKSVPTTGFKYTNGSDLGKHEEHDMLTYNSKNGQYTITVLQGDYIQFKGNNCNYPNSNLKFILNEDCYLTGKCNSLLAETNPTISDQCFSYLFENCEGIIHVYEGFLPNTTLAKKCYRGMFRGCKFLEFGPKLPATTLAESCYAGMFTGCNHMNSLGKILLDDGTVKEIIELSATNLADYCYDSMFSGCSDIKTPPKLPATTLAESCYAGMFAGCSGLTTLPVLSSTALAKNCYGGMFTDCYGITDEVFKNFALPATTMVESCYGGMFRGCAGLTTIPETLLHATTLADSCYYGMFSRCTKLVEIPGTLLPAKIMKPGCYSEMFMDCRSLTTIPETLLHATTLADSCYYGMFSGCTKLVEIPGTLLPATNLDLAKRCYASMFSKCTGLTTIPETLLPATNLDIYCYASMFSKCTGLTTIPETLLPAKTMKEGCYSGMFSECIGLAEIPGTLLPATTLDYGYGCYSRMFSECTGLTTIQNPKGLLPAKTLAKNCYKEMFLNCKTLKTHPNIDATELADYCYYKMFSGCTSLEWRKDHKPEATKYGKACYGLMFSNTKYNILDCVTLKFKEWGVDTIQSGVMIELFAQSNITDTHLTNNLPKVDDEDPNSKYCLPWQFNIGTGEDQNDGDLFIGCYSGMFKGCTELETPPELPSITLAWDCYSHMFEGCTKLKTVPKLPAKIVKPYSYFCMFKDCTLLGLGTEKELPVDFQISEAGGSLENPIYIYVSGCAYMFEGCTSLKKVPIKMLPATSFENAWGVGLGAYQGMFKDCTSLTQAPELPAGGETQGLLNSQYHSMFKNCTSLTTAPKLSHITDNLSDYVFCDMFNGCSNLKDNITINSGIIGVCSYQGMFAGCDNLGNVSIKVTQFPTDYSGWKASDYHDEITFKNWLPENNSNLTVIIEYDTTKLFKTLGEGNDTAKLTKLQELIPIPTGVTCEWSQTNSSES